MFRPAIALLAVTLPLGALAAPETYAIDPIHSYPHWEVNHFGVSNWRGRFEKTAGKFTLDRVAKTASVEITVQTASVSSGDSDKGSRARSLDEHLRTPDFFNVAEYPTMVYKSTNVIFNGDYPGSIEGNLTLLGVTKPMVLRVENWKCQPHPFNKKEMCGGNASGSFKRSDFGMKFALPAVGDEIKLWIQIEAYKT
ncbi:MAG: polyisoprenoid-binding protein [Betaproteobacteria bacterium]|nr:MAG: polyisoprenoid-binding protein [Betaproteobacteria bacterium]